MVLHKKNSWGRIVPQEILVKDSNIKVYILRRHFCYYLKVIYFFLLRIINLNIITFLSGVIILEKSLAIIKDDYPDLLRDISQGLIPKELEHYVAPALEDFKNEMAAELGLPNYEFIDKGELPSRMNGTVGGSMTKKMVRFAEAVLAWNYKQRLALREKN